jgi:hypothetical protein
MEDSDKDDGLTSLASASMLLRAFFFSFLAFFELAGVSMSVGVSCLDRAVQTKSRKGDSKGGSSGF